MALNWICYGYDFIHQNFSPLNSDMRCLAVSVQGQLYLFCELYIYIKKM